MKLSPLCITFPSLTGVSLFGSIRVVGRSGAGLTQFQSLYAVLAGLGLLTALPCLPVQTRPGTPVAAPAGAAS